MGCVFLGEDSRLEGSICISDGYSQGALFFGLEGGEGDSTSVREKSVLENDSSEDESSDLFIEEISSAEE